MRLSAVFWALLAFFALGSPAVAASNPIENVKIQISPSLTEHEAKPGETVNHAVLITNLSDTPLPVRLSVENFSAVGTNGALEFYTEKRALSADSWVAIEPAALIIDPHSQRSVQIRIAVPIDAEPGDRFIAFFAQPAAPDLQDSPSVVVRSRVGSLFLLTVKGNLHRALTIEDFQVSSVATNSVIEPLLKLHNTGNTHISASGELIIRNIFTGRIVSVQDLGSVQSLTTLPEQVRTFQLLGKTGSPIGFYRAELTIHPQDLPTISKQKAFVAFPLLQFSITIACTFLLYITRNRWLQAWKVFRA